MIARASTVTTPVVTPTPRRQRPLSAVGPVCADCRYSDVFAVQARTRCAHPNAALRGVVLFAGQQACADFVARDARDVSLSAFRAPCPATLY